MNIFEAIISKEVLAFLSENLSKISAFEEANQMLEASFGIVSFFENPSTQKPIIEIHHSNVFDFDFQQISRENKGKRFLIIGNPPWVTNSKLSSLESNNFPRKTNFKKASGIAQEVWIFRKVVLPCSNN